MYPAIIRSLNDRSMVVTLSDCEKCEVHEVLNGEYTAEMEMPVGATGESMLFIGCLIKTKSNSYDPEQIFRVSNIEKTMNDVSVEMEHISYDLNRVSVPEKFGVSSPARWLSYIQQYMIGGEVFSFSTDSTKTGNIKNRKPNYVRNMLGGSEGSLRDVFGGDLYFDNTTVKHCTRGKETGLTITYGRDITDIEQDINISKMYTDVVPFATENDVTTVGDIITLIENPTYRRVLNLDLSDKYEEGEAISKGSLATKANEYIRANELTKPAVSIEIKLGALGGDDFFKSGIEKLTLGDTVRVEFPALSLNTSSRVSEYTYNSITERYEEIKIGKVKNTIRDAISDMIQR